MAVFGTLKYTVIEVSVSKAYSHRIIEQGRASIDSHLIKNTIEALQARVDQLVTRLQVESLKFADLEGIWAGADFSLETNEGG